MTLIDFIANATAILGMLAVATMFVWMPVVADWLSQAYIAVWDDEDAHLIWCVGNRRAAQAAALEDVYER